MGSEKALQIALGGDPRTPLYSNVAWRDSYSKVWRIQYPKICNVIDRNPIHSIFAGENENLGLSGQGWSERPTSRYP